MSLAFRFDWLAVVLALAVIFALIVTVRSGERWRLWIRAGGSLILLWLILEPTVASVPASSGKPSLSVLVDVSRSMGLADPEIRLGAVKKILRTWNGFLEENFDTSYFQFSQDSSKVSWKELSRVKPYGNTTNIMGAIGQILREKKGELSAILLFSDGAHNSVQDVSDLKELDVPIHTVGVGNAAALLDIALKDLRVSDFAFKGHPVELSVKVQNFGLANKTVPVLLKEKKANSMNAISVQNITFRESAGEAVISFKFVPSAVAALEYRVEVPVQNGEIAKQNNFVDFRLDVGREKIRVLYLCGQPSPEYAFIRQILKSDPSVELVSFVILRNPENVQVVPEDQLSLIQFPAHEIFVKTLPEFDLLIFENFAYARFQISLPHLDNIRQFVESRGGGFLFIGGENSFGLGGYAGTGIEKILPVSIQPSVEAIEEFPYTVRVLEPQHPIFDIGESLAETKKFWSEMPQLSGYHRLPGVKPGATLLASVQEKGLPAMVGWQKGKGRVVAMTTLSTWQWSLGLAARDSGQGNGVQFWRQVIRWLTTPGDAKDIRIVLADSEFVVGKKSFIRVLLQSDKFRIARETVAQLTLSQPGKGNEPLPLVNAGRFEFRAEWIPQMEGEATFSAVAKSGSRRAEDRRVVPVKSVDLELENPYPDFQVLKEISRKSGGEYFSATDFSPESLKEKIRAGKKPTTEKMQTPLWTNPWPFAVLICMLLIEWGIRRYRGGT